MLNKYEAFYLENAEKQFKKLSAFLRTWQKNPSNFVLLADILRLLHSMKGAAAIVDDKISVNLLHEAETNLYNILQKQASAKDRDFVFLKKFLDSLTQNFRNIKDKHRATNKSFKKANQCFLSEVFVFLPKLVQEIAKKEHKKVSLVIKDNKLCLNRKTVDILMNIIIPLLRNAITHGIRVGQTGAQITINLSLSENNLKLVVADNGQGIDWQKIISFKQCQNMPLAKVKNLLFSLGMSLSPKITKTQGRGLGLNLVKQIVDQQHGKIAVTSNKNLGTSFSITLGVIVEKIEHILHSKTASKEARFKSHSAALQGASVEIKPEEVKASSESLAKQIFKKNQPVDNTLTVTAQVINNEQNVAIQFCPNCGAHLKSNYKFCPKCGYGLVNNI